jgi:uncharacterized protein YkwD
MNTKLSTQLKLFSSLCVVCAALLMTACGGNGPDPDPAGITDTGSSTTPSSTPPAVTPTATTPTGTTAPATPTGTTTPSNPTEVTTTIPSQPPAPTSTGQPGTISAADSCSIPNFQVEMLRAINEARSKARSCGGVAAPVAAALAWNDLLFKASAGHSKDMADRNFFSHNTPEGVNPFQRMERAGYKFGYAGETIAAGQNGIASVMGSWLNSPGHCSILMSDNYKEVGAACVKNKNGTPYWTLGIASPQ